MLTAQRFFLCLVLGGLLPAQASAQTWRFIAKDGGNISYMDTSSIKRTGQIARYWYRVEYGHPKDGDEAAVVLLEMNCTTEQYRILQSTTYNADGTSSLSTKATSWIYVQPGGPGHIMYQFICAR